MTFETHSSFLKSIGYDLMVFHHIWNATEIKKLIPGGLSFTLLRDPVDTFESGYVYLGKFVIFADHYYQVN